MSLKSAALFDKMKPHLEVHGKDIVEKTKAVYAFEIRGDKAGKPTVWTIDLKNGNGQIKEGSIDGVKPDATFVMLDEDFVKLATRQLNPQNAFMQVSTSNDMLTTYAVGQNEDQR